jgi:hypothetical protein
MRLLPCLLLPLFLASAGAASAQNRTQAVRFPSNATTAKETGKITGGEKITYTIDARSGHSASVNLKTNQAQCTFLIYGPGQTPGKHEPLYNSAVSGNGFSGFLPATGTYLVQIGQGEAAARGEQSCDYTVTFAVAR